MKSPDDDLLGALGAVAREEDAADASPFAPPPLDPRLRQRLFDVAQAGVRQGHGGVTVEPSPSNRNAASDVPARSNDEASAAPSSTTTVSRAPASVTRTTPRPRTPVARTAYLAAALAIAAGSALYLATRTGTPPDAPALAALPAYELDVGGGVAVVRSDPTVTPPLVDGAPVVLTLRPTTRFEGAVEARAFLVRGAVTEPLALASTVAAGGALRLTGTFTSALPPGPAEIVVSIGRPGTHHDPRVDGEARLVRATITVGDRR